MCGGAGLCGGGLGAGEEFEESRPVLVAGACVDDVGWLAAEKGGSVGAVVGADGAEAFVGVDPKAGGVGVGFGDGVGRGEGRGDVGEGGGVGVVDVVDDVGEWVGGDGLGARLTGVEEGGEDEVGDDAQDEEGDGGLEEAPGGVAALGRVGGRGGGVWHGGLRKGLVGG